MEECKRALICNCLTPSLAVQTDPPCRDDGNLAGRQIDYVILCSSYGAQACGGSGIQAAERKAQGPESKGWAAQGAAVCNELQREAKRGRHLLLLLLLLLLTKQGHTTDRFQLFFKVSVHRICTDCALNFLTYFIHKIVHL